MYNKERLLKLLSDKLRVHWPYTYTHDDNSANERLPDAPYYTGLGLSEAINVVSQIEPECNRVLNTLSAIPYKDLRLGDLVLSANMETVGAITDLIDLKDARRSEDNEISITWSTGSKSYQWHFMMDRVTYLGRSAQRLKGIDVPKYTKQYVAAAINAVEAEFRASPSIVCTEFDRKFLDRLVSEVSQADGLTRFLVVDLCIWAKFCNSLSAYDVSLNLSSRNGHVGHVHDFDLDIFTTAYNDNGRTVERSVSVASINADSDMFRSPSPVVCKPVVSSIVLLE